MPSHRSQATATCLGANDVTGRVKPPGEFAVGVSRRARGTFTCRHDTTLVAAIAGDGSSGGSSGDRAGNSNVVVRW